MTDDDWNAIPIRFKGIELIWLKETDVTGALAYPAHVEDGCPTFEAAFGALGNSFAHVFSDGKIWRYGSIVGSVEDLETATNS